MKHYLPRISVFQIVCLLLLAFMCAPMAMAAPAFFAPAAPSGGGLLGLASLGLGGMMLRSEASDPPASGGGTEPPKLTLGQQLSAFMKDKTALQAEITKRDTKISEHEQTIAARDTRITELEGKLKAAEDENKRLKADVEDVRQALNAAETEAKELAAKEQDLGKRASAQAKQIVQSVGIAADKLPGATSDNVQAPSHQEKLEAYAKLADTDPLKAAEYYAKEIAPALAKA